MNILKFFRSILLVSLLCILLPTLIFSQENKPFEEMVKKSDLIIIGKVSHINSQWNENKSRIYSKVHIKVNEALKGSSPGESLDIIQLGGEVDNVGELYSDTPRFTQNEEIVLFGQKDDKNNIKVTGGVEGKFSVLKDAAKGGVYLQNGISLKEFTSKIKSIVSTQ